jgi:hypothetical protein
MSLHRVQHSDNAAPPEYTADLSISFQVLLKTFGTYFNQLMGDHAEIEIPSWQGIFA